jgi:hypothetical protein
MWINTIDKLPPAGKTVVFAKIITDENGNPGEEWDLGYYNGPCVWFGANGKKHLHADRWYPIEESDKGIELTEWAMTLLCSATPSKVLDDTQSEEWCAGFGKWLAEANEFLHSVRKSNEAHRVAKADAGNL